MGGGAAGTVEPGNIRHERRGRLCGQRQEWRKPVSRCGRGRIRDCGYRGTAETDGSDPVVPPIAGIDVTGTAAVPGAIWPIGVAQVTTVPGVVGSDANGTGASVVPGVPGWVTAENGPGPLSGEIKIVPGVVGRPMAVVPMVETCAKPALQPNSRIPAVNSKRRVCDCFPGVI